jgi:hypothetical protein
MDGGLFANLAAGRMGRTTNSPLQLGQIPWTFSAAQLAKKVHSKLQMHASGLSGGRSRLRLGRQPWRLLQFRRETARECTSIPATKAATVRAVPASTFHFQELELRAGAGGPAR